MSFKYKRLDKNDAAVLLIDHQTDCLIWFGILNRFNLRIMFLALADSAKFFNLPTILTTSFDNAIMVHYFLKL